MVVNPSRNLFVFKGFGPLDLEFLTLDVTVVLKVKFDLLNHILTQTRRTVWQISVGHLGAAEQLGQS